ncbi:unnamed protein product [Darwinula stevensoni]|uniref:HECT-type E3 ubiquitin transferase n=1 Tax=Darwinula stevensoni TaxID=69355 RepID=A0A7R9FQE5_9CRUS|nr:unnamed protein product [Darwinula stevensoni]CAG0899585.1 unnamed protein product [Darwinula stevensoni]
MYSFEGDFRRHPVQSYRGASKKESRDDIVRKAQEERRKRELERKKEECALRIEAFVRGCLARKRIYRDLRSRFDELQKEVAAESGRGLTQKEEVFLTLVQWLVYFFRQQTDQKRLDWLASFLMKNQKQISSWRQENPAVWRRKLQWILHLSLRHLSQTGNHFLPLRLLEIFTQNESNAKELFFFLIKRGYYTDLRRLLDQRVPPVIDASPNPPTPLADCIYDLMVRPLALIKDSAIDSPFTLSCLGALNGQVLSTPYSEQVELFLLPALRQRTPNFPFKELLAFLSRPEASLEVPWTLYSILYLGMRHLHWTDDPSSMAYLQVLSRLMREFPCRSFLQMHYGSDEPSSDGEDEESTMEVDFSTDQHSSLEAQCLEMLNNPEQVKEIVLTVVRLPNPVTFHVASIAYGLLCYHSNAMHEYRLLQTLALQPLFLQKLWRHLHDGKSSASSSPNFYSQLKQLSSGINLNAEDSDGLIPLLASFPASLSILFLLLNDEELFGSPVKVKFSKLTIVTRSLIAFDEDRFGMFFGF